MLLTLLTDSAEGDDTFRLLDRELESGIGVARQPFRGSRMGTDARFIDENYIWWRRVGRLMGGRGVDAVAKPTRRPGRYSLVWDGRDDKGQPAPQGRYTVHIEASREHGGHAYQTLDVALGAQAVNAEAPGADELGPAAVHYGPGR